jgi:oxygen-independent coproporphyrinogen-3 oxidase
VDVLSPAARTRVAGLVADGLVDARAALGAADVPGRRVRLTRRGRLLADAVVRTLAD